jgi:hypothetical protein
MFKIISKVIPILILLVLVGFPLKSPAQNNNGQLAAKDGYTLNEANVQFYVNLVQFVVSEKIKKSEAGEIRAQAIGEFNRNPKNFFTELNQFYSFMSQLYQLSDPVKIAQGRMYFVTHFYKVTRMTPKQNLPALIKIVNRYVRVLHYNPQTQMILTNKDIDAFLNYLDFSRQLGGLPAMNYLEKRNFKQSLPNYYSQMPVQQQAMFPLMPVVWQNIEGQWKRLTPQQKQQVIANFRVQMSQQQQQQTRPQYQNYPNNNTYPQTSPNQNGPKTLAQKRSEFQARQQLFQTMSNMNNMSHVTTMNIIENMGNTGNYWTLQDN